MDAFAPPSPHACALAAAAALAAVAVGLLGIALANEEYGDEAVQTPLVPAACSYLQRAVLSHRPAIASHAAGAGHGGSSGGSVGRAGSGATAAATAAGDGQHSVVAVKQELPPLLVAAAQQAEGFNDDVQQLRMRRLLGVIRCLTCTGEYVEALGPFLSHQGVECCCILMQAWKQNGVLLNEVLQLVCSMLAHRRFGELLVELGGVQLLLACPR